MSNDYVKRARVGSLKTPITFEGQTSTISPTGAETKTWAPIITVKGKAFDMYGKEYVEANQRFSHATTVFTVRHSTAITGIGTRERILCDGVYYDIVGFDRNPKHRPRWVSFYAVSADGVDIQS